MLSLILPMPFQSRLLCSIALLGAVCLPADAQTRCDRLVSASDNSAGLVAGGGLVTVFCTGLSGIQGVQNANGFPLPYELAGIRVSVRGLNAPILSVANLGSYQQINFQNPAETSDRILLSHDTYVIQGTLRLLVRPSAGAIGPALFRDERGYAIAQHASDYSLVTSENPARAGEHIILYGTGITNYSNLRNAPAFGMPAPSEPLAWTPAETNPARPVNGPFMTFFGPDGIGVFKGFSWVGLTPGTVGVFQMNFQMPEKLVKGAYWLIVSRAYEEADARGVRLNYVSSRSVGLYVGE